VVQPDVSVAKRNRIRIFINDQAYFATDSAMTGAALAALGGVPSTNQLFLDTPGPGDDQPVAADATIQLRAGMKFYDVPVGTFG